MNTIYKDAELEYLNTDLTLREVSKKFKIDRGWFSKYLKSKGISTKRKLKVDITIFEKIDNEEKAYWLGFLYADGCVYYKKRTKSYRLEVGLAEKDYSHLLKLKKFLKSEYKIRYRSETKSYSLEICSKKICDDLIKLGCVPRKSLILTFPTFLDRELIKHFIRGYFDGDGCISTIKTSPGISILGTNEFLTYITNIYQKDKPLFKDKRHKNNTFSIRFKVNNGLFFLYDIYNNANVYLDRKYKKYIFLLNCRSRKKFFELLESKYGEG